MASPKDPQYGAAGDGATDDTAAINACLAQNRVVDFGGPENTYLITGTVLVGRPDSQVVTGRGACLKAGAAVDMMRLAGAAHTVSGLVFDGNGQAGGRGVVVEPGAHHTRIAACAIRQCLGIDVADASYCMVLDNELLDCGSGITFRASSSALGIGWFTCRGNKLTGSGIALRSVRGGRVDGNAISGFAGNGVDCAGCAGVTIAGNTVQGGRDGVFVGGDPSQGITITGNVLTGAQRGVRVSTDTAGVLITGVVVTANTIVAPTEGAVLVSRTGSAQVSGVTVVDNDLQIGYGGGQYGVKMVNAEVCRVARNRVFRPLREAVHLHGVDIVQVTGNTLLDAGYASADTYDAVYVTNANRAVVRDNLVYGSAGYAVRITGGTGMTASGNRWRSLTRGGIYSQATNNNVYFDNRGFVPTVRVMPLGDSITEGSGLPGGYRTDLWRRLVASGHPVDFVGSQNNGPADLGDHDHEGHPGWRIDQLDAQLLGWLQDSRPRTVLLHVGTNDVLQAYDLAAAPNRLATLIDRMLGAVPYLELFVATIGPLADSTRESNAAAYNAGLRSIVAGRGSTGRVHLVEMRAALTIADLADGVHPTAAGYAKMAGVWHDVLVSVPNSLTLPPASAG
jgi:lysophospholipase L1-like esterase/nitrous oxidase accessory protein NosD